MYCTVFQAEKHNASCVQTFILTVNAGVVTYKALDSSENWATLDQGAKDILESLLHDLPERRLTATQLLNKRWLYEAQGKPFPTGSIFNPPVSEVPIDISRRIQRRVRHPQLLPVVVDPLPAHMRASHQTSRRARQHGFSNSFESLSESGSGSGSLPASQSLSGFTSQSGSESLRSASEHSSSVTESSSESFARSEDSSLTSDADSDCSSLQDPAMDSRDQVSHDWLLCLPCLL